MNELRIPELALVVLVGACGAGKSTFARARFSPTEVLSADAFRAMVADDETDQAATPAAFDALYHVAGIRLAAGRLTVVDATSVRRADRASLVELARAHDVLPVAIVLDLPESVCAARDAARGDRAVGAAVVARQHRELRRGLRGLGKEGFRRVHVLSSTDEVDGAVVVRERLRNDLRERTGPFDVIGDVHGCRAELELLLTRLGYRLDQDDTGRPIGATHPDGRCAVFVGDLVDRGPDTPGVLRLVMGMVAAGTALAVLGNHEVRLVRALDGRQVALTHGLAESLTQLAVEPAAFRAAVRAFCDGLLAHYVLDGGRLVVAHAGLPQAYHGRASGRVRSFAIWGQTTGETDEFGLPVRHPWAQEYRGEAVVLYGHVPTPDAEWVNRTMCLDTGAVFGGALTALRWPEREVVAVPAAAVYAEPVRPLRPAGSASASGSASAAGSGGPVAEREPGVLHLSDVIGKRVLTTRLLSRITVPAERAAAALEVMSRFAVDPRWLPYLPPTMAPAAARIGSAPVPGSAGESSPPPADGPMGGRTRPAGFVEHPIDAFADYQRVGVAQVMCQEKHMGSRAVVLLCRDDFVGPRRFGAPGRGALVSRTGRALLDPRTRGQLLDGWTAAAAAAGLFDELGTDWLLLDAELLPWNAGAADELLRTRFGETAAVADAATAAATAVLAAATARGLDVAELAARTAARAEDTAAFRDQYRRHVRPVDGAAGIRLAPFQVLAAEGATFGDRPHDWHLAVADRLYALAPDLIAPTASVVVDTGDPASVAAGVDWWSARTAAGAEGMVVKPLANLVLGPRGPVQPGLKVRGPEYLRLVYGADYRSRIDRLRRRDTGRKRSLALREYALGVEALERFVAGEPLWRVHECVFAVLACESEPVDPHL